MINALTPAHCSPQITREFARIAALAAALSLQLVWVGILACATQCARGECLAAMETAPGSLSDHCAHGTPAGAPGKHGGSSPHGPLCPASHHYHLMAEPVAHSTAAANSERMIVASVPAPPRVAMATMAVLSARRASAPSDYSSPPLTPLRV